jgi:hypothetical protein
VGSSAIVTGAVSANTGFSTSTSTGYSINGVEFVYYDGTTYLILMVLVQVKQE